MQEVRHDPVLQEDQRPVSLLRRQEMVGRAPGVPGGFEPFGRPQLKHLLAGAVPGAQLRAQHLAHQAVVPEAGPVLIEGHQEQVSGIDAAQQRRRVLPSGDRGARVRGQFPGQDGGVEHELGQLGRLLVEHLGDEVVGEVLAADLQHPRQPRRVGGPAQGQRRHLQDRGPPLAPLVEQRQVGVGYLGRRSSPAGHGSRRGRSTGRGPGSRSAGPTSAAGAGAAAGRNVRPAPAGRSRPASAR